MFDVLKGRTLYKAASDRVLSHKKIQCLFLIIRELSSVFIYLKQILKTCFLIIIIINIYIALFFEITLKYLFTHDKRLYAWRKDVYHTERINVCYYSSVNLTKSSVSEKNLNVMCACNLENKVLCVEESHGKENGMWHRRAILL